MQSLNVKQDVISCAEVGREVMFIFRDHGLTGAPPYVYVTALAPNCSVSFASGMGIDTDRFAPTSTINLVNKGAQGRIALPITGIPTDQVSIARVVSGSVTLSIVSPTAVQTEFRTRKHP